MVGPVRFHAGWMAVQAVPRLSKELGLHLDLPEERMIFGMSAKEVSGTVRAYEEVLGELVAEHGVSWWDVYTHSDIGRERLALAREMGIGECDAVLDVGCGRGYFTIALATICGTVCSLDLMNGYGRQGWWEGLLASMMALGLDKKVVGERASATEIPFRDGSFSLAVSAHALRNFRDKSTIIEALKEMRRVTRKHGRVIVAENLPVARSKAQEAHVKMFNLKARHARGDSPLFTEAELLQMFDEAGLSPDRTEVHDLGLSATPPIFVLDSVRIPKVERKSAETEYAAAVEMIRKNGESSTPVILVEAVVK